jgi:hypothetical protein
MARRTFFSFHHQRDVVRAGQVRNSWVTQDREAAGFWDAAEWESVRKKDKATIEKWIDEQMKGTSVTVVLIGAETSTRPHVDYEIVQSHKSNKGMLGIYIHKIKNFEGKTDTKGASPFSKWKFTKSDGTVVSYPTYDWVDDDGRSNMGDWIEAAAKKAGR